MQLITSYLAFSIGQHNLVLV